MKKVLIFVLSLLSALTFSLSSCSSSSVFKKIEIYGYGKAETLSDELNDLAGDYLKLEFVFLFKEDYLIQNQYGIQLIRKNNYNGYKSVYEYLNEAEYQSIDGRGTPSNRQVTIEVKYYDYEGISPLEYIAIYDCSENYGFNERKYLLEVIKFSISEVIYKQYDK